MVTLFLLATFTIVLHSVEIINAVPKLDLCLGQPHTRDVDSLARRPSMELWHTLE